MGGLLIAGFMLCIRFLAVSSRPDSSAIISRELMLLLCAYVCCKSSKLLTDTRICISSRMVEAVFPSTQLTHAPPVLRYPLQTLQLKVIERAGG